MYNYKNRGEVSRFPSPISFSFSYIYYMSITLDIQPASNISVKTLNSASYFDTHSIVITPDNKIRLTKKPHKPFHRQENRDPLAYSHNCKNLKNDPYRESIVSIDSEYLVGESFDIEFDGTSFTPLSYKTPVPELPKKKKFTRKARNTMLQAAGALEKEGYKPQQFWMFTGTLPGNSEKACEGISRNSRNIVNRFKQHLRDRGFYLTLNSWEFQKRDKVRGFHRLTPALHLHFVVVVPDCSGYEWLENFLNQKWFDILDDISKNTPYNLYEIDEKLGGGSKKRDDDDVMKYGAKTVQCNKSPLAYLSKYMSKEASDQQCNIENFTKNRDIPIFYPSSWWSISHGVRDLIKKHTYSLSLRVAPEDSELVFEDIASFLTSLAIQPQSKVIHPDYPDYWCQCFFVPGDIYDDVKNILSGMCDEYKKQSGVLDKDSKQLTFDDTIVAWMHLPKNKHYLDEFLYYIPAYYRIGNASIDFTSSAIKSRLRKYYFSKIGNPDANKPLAIDGF